MKIVLKSSTISFEASPLGTTDIGGQQYKTIKIGSQVWLAENLDLQFEGLIVGGSTVSSTDKMANYYNNDQETYGINGTKKCGLLYNGAAMLYMEQNKATLFPGWRIPSTEDFNTLLSYVGSNAGKKLKASDNLVYPGFPSGFNGTNDVLFSVLPGGNAYLPNFAGSDSRAYFWTLDKAALEFKDNLDSVNSLAAPSFNYSLNIRLIRE